MASRAMRGSAWRLRRVIAARFAGPVCTHPRRHHIAVDVEHLEIDGIAIETAPAIRCGRCSRWVVPTEPAHER